LGKSIPAVLALTLLAVPASGQTTTGTWTIDSNHTSAQFAVKHMMVSTVRGKLGKVSGAVMWDGINQNSVQADVTIDVAGLDTGVEARDKDLRSETFFNVADYPNIVFRSKRAIPGTDGQFKLVGDLTIRGTSKEVTLDVEGPSPAQKTRNNLRTGASATTVINRRDFGLMYNRLLETGGAVVGDEIRITIDLEVTRPVPSS
jgi:polyisoprenoid-binding protein YceI